MSKDERAVQTVQNLSSETAKKPNH